MVRVGIISSYAGSISNFRGALIREMIDRGFVVFVLAPDYDQITRTAVISLGAVPVDYSLSRAGINPLKDILDIVRLWGCLRHLCLDVTLAYFIKPVIYGSMAARFAGVPRRFAMIEGAGYVFIDSERVSLRQYVLRALVVWLYRLGLRQVDRVFVLNSDDKALFIKERMITAERIKQLHGIGVDLDYYRFTPPSLTPFCFLFIGRLLIEKGVREFVAAARDVKKIFPATRFMMLGGIDSNPGSLNEKEVEAWVAEGVVECPGVVPDVRIWIAQASVFVLPSYREGMPRSTQEAMAMGRPVITTDVPGCRETVTDGLNGFVVSVRDDAALAAAMRKFLEKPELVISMGVESRRIAEERFDVRKINSVIMKILNLDEACD